MTTNLRPSPDGSRFLCSFFYRDVDDDGQYGVADMSALEIGLLGEHIVFVAEVFR